ncbi:uncharacterized protein LOC116304626 [Actinia tenebrosa]|uniref:Uncharacterized protein LOC116304626 n=1 Tax=Actinia tenebrosa TaxID=6105 RepID=A0A6P8ITC4_ACTTE|nr:uncharacterized protein LOC116304626 [Actinia tenebrosa]
MAVVVEPLPAYSQLDEIIKEVARDYSKIYLEQDIAFTKNTLGGNFLKLPHDDIFPYLQELRDQGRITPQKTGFLEFYAKDKPSIVERMESLKKQSMKEKENEIEFIGRENDVSAVVDNLTNGTTMIMTLYGDAGVGKTTLADKVVEFLTSQNQVAIKKKVDLRNMDSQKEVCLAILHALDSKKVLNPCMEFVYEAIENLEKSTILILDNAEEVLSQLSLQESKASFTQILRGMAEHINKSRKLTILLTSRIPLPDEINGFVNYKVNSLDEAKSATVLEKSNLSLSPEEKNEISKLCKNNPLKLNLVAGLMQESLLNIEHLKKVLNALEEPAEKEKATEKEEDIYANAYDNNIFSEVFENPFTPELKKATIKLSLFQGPFTIEDAVKMIKQSKDETKFYLDILTVRKFLTNIDQTTYEMHPSINEFMISQSQKENYEDIITDAKETFFKNYLEKSKQIAQLLDEDYVRAYSLIEKERLNLKLAIEISFERGFLYFSSDYSESTILADLFLILIPGLEREKLFREWSAIAEKKGEWICYTILVCMHIQVLLEKTAGKSEARKLLGKAKEALNKLSDKTLDAYQLAKSSYLYAKGEMLYSDCASKGREVCGKAEWREVLDFYQQSLKIREELLKDHTDTARTLNAIGNCFMYLEELEKACEYYTRALEMRQRLSGQQHVDMPVYINQIAATHEQMGSKLKKQAEDANLYYRKGLTEKYIQEFNEALKKYQEALDLEKKLHISGYINTAIFYRNMSNTYSYLEDYESSLRTAKKALFVRKKLLGIDSDTIRSYYQVGLAYEQLEDIDKALKYFYKAYMMEKALPEGETSPVRDRVIKKIENNGGSTEEAELEDKRHEEALQKGSLDDDVLTSEDEEEEEEEEEEEKEEGSSKEEWQEEKSLSSVDDTAAHLDYVTGTPVQTTDQGLSGTTVQTTDQGPSGTTVQTTDQVPSWTTGQTTDQKSSETTQEERETIDVADIEIEERVVSDRQVIGAKGCQWDIKETGVRILFMPGTVPSDTSIPCHVCKEPENHLPLEPTESLVSMVVALDADNPVFDKEIGLLIPHSGSMKTKGYEVAVREYKENLGIWEEVDDFINIQHESDVQNLANEFTKQLGSINLPAVLLTRKNCSTVCVTSRLVKDVLIARPAGSTLVSSVFPEVQLVLEKNTVKKNTSIDMKVHPLPDFTVFNSPSLSCGPVLYLQTSQTETIDILKPIRITLPHPLTWYGKHIEEDSRRGKVRILYNRHSGNSDIEWKDITDNPATNLSVDGQKISLQVRHFSMFWPIWISDIKQDFQKLLIKAKEQFASICRFSPFSAQFCVKCRPRNHKGQAVLAYTAVPTHLVKQHRRNRNDDSEEDLYDGEEIQVDLTGPIQRYPTKDSDDSPFYIKFSSQKEKQKSMDVEIEDEDGMFRCRFLRVLVDHQCICEIPFDVPPVKQDIKELKPLEFYGVPLEDPDNKWCLLETPKDVLQSMFGIKKLGDIAKNAYDIKSSDEESMEFFFQSVSHDTNLQQSAFDAVISNQSRGIDHIKQVLEAGKKVVEESFDVETARSLSKYIKQDYTKLAQKVDLSDKCNFIKKMKGTSSDLCFIFLKTWISHKKPTLHLLMQKLREIRCEEGMKALMKQFEDRLEKIIRPEASASESENTVVTVEGHYQEASTTEPLAGQHIDTRKTIDSPATETSSDLVQGFHAGSVITDIDTSVGYSIDESHMHWSPVADVATDVSLNDSSISASTTSDADETLPGEDAASNEDSPDSASDIIDENTSSSISLFYPGMCLVALSLGYIFFRYIRR